MVETEKPTPANHTLIRLQTPMEISINTQQFHIDFSTPTVCNIRLESYYPPSCRFRKDWEEGNYRALVSISFEIPVREFMKFWSKLLNTELDKNFGYTYAEPYYEYD